MGKTQQQLNTTNKLDDLIQGWGSPSNDLRSFIFKTKTVNYTMALIRYYKYDYYIIQTQFYLGIDKPIINMSKRLWTKTRQFRA